MSVRNIAKRYAEKQLTGAEALAELKEKDLLGEALMTLLV
ncbi:DNA primase, partial [Pseudomonas aeruginosa]